MKLFFIFILAIFFAACNNEHPQTEESQNEKSKSEQSQNGQSNQEQTKVNEKPEIADTILTSDTSLADNTNELNSKKQNDLKKYNCFKSVINQDTTIISLVIQADVVKGTMVWKPYQKDAAAGALSGGIDENGEMMLIYDYVIEGNKQSETKMMKIDGNKLLIKKGELEDPYNDGNLRYKDISKAKYSEVLEKFNCSE